MKNKIQAVLYIYIIKIDVNLYPDPGAKRLKNLVNRFPP